MTTKLPYLFLSLIIVFSQVQSAPEDDECAKKTIKLLESSNAGHVVVPCEGGNVEYKLIHSKAEPIPILNQDAPHPILIELEQYWERGDYSEIVKLSSSLTAFSDPKVQYRIGVAHLSITPPKSARAAFFFEQAAERGHFAAKFELALLYLAGKGVEENQEKGVALLEEAAAAGHHNAQSMLDRARKFGYWGFEKSGDGDKKYQ